MTTATKAPKRLNLSEMTKVEARLAIAKDVIWHIRAGQYIAQQGIYIDIYDELQSRESLQCAVDNVRSGNVDCDVCGVGAGVVSVAGLFNGKQFTTAKHEDDVDHHAVLRKYFSKKTVAAIECAFEIDELWLEALGKYQLGLRCKEWGKQWEEPSDRLEAIYTNLLANEGEFNVEWMPSNRSRLGRVAIKAGT